MMFEEGQTVRVSGLHGVFRITRNHLTTDEVTVWGGANGRASFRTVRKDALKKARRGDTVLSFANGAPPARKKGQR